MAKRSRKQQIQRYLEGLHGGESDLELQAELDLPKAAFEAIKASALGNEIERVKEVTTEQTYVEYCLAQRGCINDLNDLIETCKTENKHLSAIVTAVRARSDIIDKMIKLGQEFGIVEKKPEEKRIVAGVVVAQLSNDELRAAIAEQISSLNTLVTQYGNHKFTDVEPGELYRELPAATVIEAKLESESEPESEPEPEPASEPEPPPAPKVNTNAVSERARRLLAQDTAMREVKDKTNRAKSNKVHRGRRVVKPPMR